MTGDRFRLIRFDPRADLGSFDCGEPHYNEWLTMHAGPAVASGSSMVYLLVIDEPADTLPVLGYFAICPTMVRRDGLPRPAQRNLMNHAPGWLLAKLAIDRSLQGDREAQWGAQLLREALETIMAAADRGGGQIIVVDPDNSSLVDWYGRHGFIPTGADTLRMYMKVATARKYLGPA